MIERLYAVNVIKNGVIGSTSIVLNHVDENKQVKSYGLTFDKMYASGQFECENFSWDGSVFKLNGVQYTDAAAVINKLFASRACWWLVDRLTDNNGNCIGVGMLSNGRYLRAKESDAIARIEYCANAFMRDGAIVNKCKETPKVNIVDTVSKPVPVEKPVVAPQNNVLKGDGLENKSMELPGTHEKEIPKAPVVPNVVKKIEPKEQSVPTATASEKEDNDLEVMKALVDELNYARYVYEQGVDEVMSNKEYDAKYDQLLELEKKTGVIINGSPTQEVGHAVVSELTKCAHETAMLSLGKTKSIGDLASFLGSKEGILSWKLDGLTVVLTYEGGELTQAVTRGNGYVGELVTSNAKTFIGLPRRISRVDKIVIRTEALMSYSDFKDINAEAGGVYKNPRNLASGSVRQLDSKITARRRIRAIAFEWVNAPDSMSKEQQLQFLAGLGFEPVQFVKVNSEHVGDAVNAFKVAIEKFKYPSDGLVLTYDDVAYGRSLGSDAKTPKHSIAFKWQDEEEESELIDIDWTVGRSGVITPTAVFQPVDIDGTTVTRASLHNLSVMEQVLGRPYVGQKIWVYKANMIIPQISKAEKYEEYEARMKNGRAESLAEHRLMIENDPRVTRMGTSNVWTVQYMGDEVPFDSYEAAVMFADDNGITV